MENNEKMKIFEALDTYGGGFEKAFAECLIKADSENLKKLVEAFPEIIEKAKMIMKFA